MKDLSSNITRLQTLAKQVIGTKADYILVVEEYAQLLAQIEPDLNEAANNPDLRDKLKQLENLHQQVMAKVEAEKDKIRSDISSLKKKGKVVITYTDQLPKRISLGTKRKI